MKRTALKRKPWRRALGTAEQRLRFKQSVLEADGGRCLMDPRQRVNDPDLVYSKRLSIGLAGSCDGPLQAAHVIRKHTLRKCGYGANVVYSVGAAMTLCQHHHEAHDSYALRVPEALWPARCREFAERITNERTP